MAETRDEEEPREHQDDMLHVFLRRAWITVGVLVALFVLGVGADQLTASACGACHEIAPQLDTKSTSGHAQLRCPDCHEDSRPWYRFPETLAVRTVMLVRNIGPHLSYEIEGGASPLEETQVTIEDEKCLECHDPSREVTLSDEGVLIDHDEHIEENDSCISCHRYTAHPIPGVDPALSFMRQCFTCHGFSEDAEAPGECIACHPESFDLVPASHDPEVWRTEHGDSALDDRDLCLICHEETFCDDCHGLDMPHPEDWADGATVHGVVVRERRAACETCHADTTDFCTVCHHEDFSISLGSWVSQHYLTVAQKGAAECMRCHEPLFCVDCHTERDIEAAALGG